MFVEHDVAFVFDVLTGRVRSPQSMHDGRVVLQVVRPEHALDVLSGLLCARSIENGLARRLVRKEGRKERRHCSMPERGRRASWKTGGGRHACL